MILWPAPAIIFLINWPTSLVLVACCVSSFPETCITAVVGLVGSPAEVEAFITIILSAKVCMIFWLITSKNSPWCTLFQVAVMVAVDRGAPKPGRCFFVSTVVVVTLCPIVELPAILTPLIFWLVFFWVPFYTFFFFMSGLKPNFELSIPG